MSTESRLIAADFMRIVANFHTLLASPEFRLPKSAFGMFEPTSQTESSVPDEAWWDQIDAFLASLTSNCLAEWFSHIGKRDDLVPVAGAISRHEPVLRKVPQYAFPDENAWEKHVLRADANPVVGQKTYAARIRKMQEQALERVFSKVPVKNLFPRGHGLVPLLEHVAVYPKCAEQTATCYEKGVKQTGWAHKARVLIVDNLSTNSVVSEAGRASYQAKGCILLPIVSHDLRLIGSALVIYNRPFAGADWNAMDEICDEWRLVLDTTFAPLLANLNTAALSALDSFFLGRVRELRHCIATAEQNEEGGAHEDESPPVPTEDCFVLNKIALYEAIQTRLSSKSSFKLVFFDLDGFKGINEKIGHQFADVFLFHIAMKLTRGRSAPFCPQKDQWLFRFGGDEFVGLVPSGVKMADLSQQVNGQIQAAKDAYDLDVLYNKKHTLDVQRVSCSMGWVSSEDLASVFTPSVRNDKKGRAIVESIADHLGLDKDKRSVYQDMRDPLVLLELADTHTQERVKDFGKGGWLEFKERIKLSFNGRSAGKHLLDWLEAINWFQEYVNTKTPQAEYERTLKSDIRFFPPP